MRTNQLTVPIAAIAIALGSFSAEAQERGERGNRGDQNQRQERSRSNASAQRVDRRSDRGRSSDQRGQQDRPQADSSAQRRSDPVNRGGNAVDRTGDRGRYSGAGERSRRSDGRDSTDYGRNGGYAPRRDYDRGRSDDRRRSYGGGYGDTYGYSRNYYAPRLLSRRSAPRYYGSGRLNLYFGIGSGYLYGSPYSGRVYGYRGRGSAYGGYQSYGDVRLQVSPRDAAVYVDGYYAGVVDDFDGYFQRLTLEVGPHEIEVTAPGLDSQVFDVYVDPSRTVNLHADLLR